MQNRELGYLVVSNELKDISYRSNPPEETIHPRIDNREDGPYVYCQKIKTALVVFLTRLANGEPSLRVAGYREANGKKVQTTISFNKRERVTISPRLETILDQLRTESKRRGSSINVPPTSNESSRGAKTVAPHIEDIEAALTGRNAAPFSNEEFDNVLFEAGSIGALLDGFDGEEQDVLAKRRVNQGRFRKSLLRYWNSRCCITNVDDERLLVASHIIPWSKSSKQERGDPTNGLLLSVTWDALFDRGLVSFADDGCAILEKLNHDLVSTLGLDRSASSISINRLTDRHRQYLKRHRQLFGFE